MNRDVRESGGAALVVPQFTLYGDARRRTAARTSLAAARPEVAEPLFERFCDALAAQDVRVERGVFRAHMQVELLNDGPVTLMIETPASRERRSVKDAGLLLAGRRRRSCWLRPRRAGWRCCARRARPSRWWTRAPTAPGPGGPSPGTACARWRSTRRGAWPRGGPARW